MRLFDTHCHFDSSDPEAIRVQLERARAAGVERVMAVGGSNQLNASAEIAASFGCLMAQGRDRDQLGNDFEPIPAGAHLAAWGEIGLDYHYSPETRDRQLEVFASGLEEARSRDLPVVIHTREADDDTLAVLREVPSRGIIHCFTGSPDFAAKLLDLGFYVSISGIVTFRAADNVRESALSVPDDRLLIETDSPFLAPVPMRGNPNEPVFLRHTCEFLARLRGLDPEALAELTFGNAEMALTGKVRAVVAFGSNVEPRARYIEEAAESLSRLPGTRLIKRSAIRETDPVDVPEEFANRKFLNAAALFETELGVEDFFRRMQSIETQLKRVRSVRNAPRTIDLDLIDFGGVARSDPHLTLPHPRAKARQFVLEPLAELGVRLI